MASAQASAPAQGLKLTAARYGKSYVRLLRVVRDAGIGRHEVAEYNITLLVEGAFETSFTEADNSVVVATDSMKNIVNGTIVCYRDITGYSCFLAALAKTSPYVMHPELFAIHIGTLVVQKYRHLNKAFVDIEKLRWTRIVVDGKEHAHAFIRDGDDKETTSVEVDGTSGKQNLGIKVTSGIKDLLVLKSTGSAFEGFVRDEFTTLVEVSDRILSTAVDLTYTLDVPNIGGVDDLAALEDRVKFRSVGKHARDITLEIFANDESASVQASLYKMACRLIDTNGSVSSASYRLPNKHYVPVDMRYLGIENLDPKAAEVFTPLAAPSGLISATVSRS